MKWFKEESVIILGVGLVIVLLIRTDIFFVFLFVVGIYVYIHQLTKRKEIDRKKGGISFKLVSDFINEADKIGWDDKRKGMFFEQAFEQKKLSDTSSEFIFHIKGMKRREKERKKLPLPDKKITLSSSAINKDTMIMPEINSVFEKQAKKEGWSEEEILVVLEEAYLSNFFDGYVKVLLKYVKFNSKQKNKSDNLKF